MNRVVIGLSGGVDSSVAAYLLKKQGYEVVGITFKTLNDFDSSKALKVADSLGIEFHEMDIVDDFNTTIIESFLDDYKNGLTPNPCSLCNKEIKFKYLYKAMNEYHADYMATGHYAKIIDGKIFKSADLNKDQSYFISLIPNEYINHTIFPLEGIDKEEVRKIASEINLFNADAKDSYDVCFINDKFKEYMVDKLGTNPGDIINLDNNQVIGKHNGLSFYTIGQRRGLDIGGYKEPLFVVGKSVKNNILYVAEGSNTKYLISNNCIINNINMFRNDIKDCTAKFRYRSKEINVNLEYIDGEHIKVNYPDGVSGVTPGQTCVFYLENEVVGAGKITEIYNNSDKLWYL